MLLHYSIMRLPILLKVLHIQARQGYTGDVPLASKSTFCNMCIWIRAQWVFHPDRTPHMLHACLFVENQLACFWGKCWFIFQTFGALLRCLDLFVFVGQVPAWQPAGPRQIWTTNCKIVECAGHCFWCFPGVLCIIFVFGPIALVLSVIVWN